MGGATSEPEFAPQVELTPGVAGFECIFVVAHLGKRQMGIETVSHALVRRKSDAWG